MFEMPLAVFVGNVGITIIEEDLEIIKRFVPLFDLERDIPTMNIAASWPYKNGINDLAIEISTAVSEITQGEDTKYSSLDHLLFLFDDTFPLNVIRNQILCKTIATVYSDGSIKIKDNQIRTSFGKKVEMMTLSRGWLCIPHIEH